MRTWRGRRVVVLTPSGKLRRKTAAYVSETAHHVLPGVLVVDLLRSDARDTDAVAALLRALAAARRTGWCVLVANAAPDVEVALRPLSIRVVDTAEGPGVDRLGHRPRR